jgi:FkbM family methyltransferase
MLTLAVPYDSLPEPMIRRDRPADAGLLLHILMLIDQVFLTRARRYVFLVRIAVQKLLMLAFHRPLQLMRLPLKTRSGLRSFFVRWNSHADLGVYYQVFINKDYDLSRFALGIRIAELHKSFLAQRKQPLIIDAGANIGASAVWFATSFPKSRLVAIEPAPGNCELLKRNCAGIDLELFAGGISSQDGTMYLSDPGCGDWAFRVVEKGSVEVPVFSASRIVDSEIRKSAVPFICKVDIEGGEDHLFRENTGWTDKFPLLIVELHDYMLPGGARSKGLLTCLSKSDFDVVPHGENVFCFNNRLLNRGHNIDTAEAD